MIKSQKTEVKRERIHRSHKSDELLVPEIPESEEDVEEMIGLLGLDRSWCMTCVHWPCMCALTKREMKISALRGDCYAKEVEKDDMNGEALVVEDGEVVGGLLGGNWPPKSLLSPK